MRKFKSIPRITKINNIEGFKVFCAFNNGEHRIIDFKVIFNELNYKNDELRKRIMIPETFRTVTVLNNTLTWEKVVKTIKLKSGKEFTVAFDIDPVVLYNFSEPDLVRNNRYKIGQFLKNERLKAGITQEELALKCGTTRNYISRIENDKSDIELRTLRKIIEIGLDKELELAIS